MLVKWFPKLPDLDWKLNLWPAPRARAGEKECGSGVKAYVLSDAKLRLSTALLYYERAIGPALEGHPQSSE